MKIYTHTIGNFIWQSSVVDSQYDDDWYDVCVCDILYWLLLQLQLFSIALIFIYSDFCVLFTFSYSISCLCIVISIGLMNLSKKKNSEKKNLTILKWSKKPNVNTIKQETIYIILNVKIMYQKSVWGSPLRCIQN